MKKMGSLFVREKNGKHYLATEEVTPGCEWVINGEGTPTEKIDGECCLIKSGLLYARHALKQGREPPPGWFHWSLDPDQISGHGWVPVGGGPEHKWHREAWPRGLVSGDGTYELIGPKVQSNPYGTEFHELIRHGSWPVSGNPRTYHETRSWLEENRKEGIVWHHPDGRMVKVKRRDFGIAWPGEENK